MCIKSSGFLPCYSEQNFQKPWHSRSTEYINWTAYAHAHAHKVWKCTFSSPFSDYIGIGWAFSCFRSSLTQIWSHNAAPTQAKQLYKLQTPRGNVQLSIKTSGQNKKGSFSTPAPILSLSWFLFPPLLFFYSIISHSSNLRLGLSALHPFSSVSIPPVHPPQSVLWPEMYKTGSTFSNWQALIWLANIIHTGFFVSPPEAKPSLQYMELIQ